MSPATGQNCDKRSRKWKVIGALVLIIGVAVPIIRHIAKGGVCTSKARLDGKFVIITGANTGIGKETARDLIRRGARVLLACRSHEKCTTAADDISHTTGHRPNVKLLDLADLDSVRQFSQDILDQEKRLDILINNAGVMMCPRMESKQGYELQFATNHLGHFLLTNLLLPLLKRSAPSRVVVVSSSLHTQGVINFEDINSKEEYGALAAYTRSKLANILFTNELAKKLKGSGVTVNSLHPGVISSDLQRHVEDMAPSILQVITRPAFSLVKMLLMKTVEQGAQTTICCSVSEELEEVTGRYFSDCQEVDLHPRARDEDVARRLWELSERMVGLKSTEEQLDDESG